MQRHGHRKQTWNSAKGELEEFVLGCASHCAQKRDSRKWTSTTRQRYSELHYMNCKNHVSKHKFKIAYKLFFPFLNNRALSIKLLRLGAIGQFLSKAIEPPPLDAVRFIKVNISIGYIILNL